MSIAVLAAMALTGCDDGAAPRNVTSIAVTDADNSLARLRGLDQANRDLALRRAVHDSGEACKRITASGEQEPYEGLAMWSVRCEDGPEWAIFIAPTGDIQVRACAQTVELGLPACRFETAG